MPSNLLKRSAFNKEALAHGSRKERKPTASILYIIILICCLLRYFIYFNFFVIFFKKLLQSFLNKFNIKVAKGQNELYMDTETLLKLFAEEDKYVEFAFEIKGDDIDDERLRQKYLGIAKGISLAIDIILKENR